MTLQVKKFLSTLEEIIEVSGVLVSKSANTARICSTRWRKLYDARVIDVT